MPSAPTGSDLDLLKFLGERDIRMVLRNYAKANQIAAGMVRSSNELQDLYNRCKDSPSEFGEDDRQKYQSWRITPVTNQDPHCQSIRVPLEGELGCFCSDAQNSQAAHQRGAPVLYRCHTGKIEIVCGVYVGTRHVANIYGGQVRLALEHPQKLGSHPLLKEFVIPDCETDSPGRTFQTAKAPTPEPVPPPMGNEVLGSV